MALTGMIMGPQNVLGVNLQANSSIRTDYGVTISSTEKQHGGVMIIHPVQ